jgi:hypothetical protein
MASNSVLPDLSADGDSIPSDTTAIDTSVSQAVIITSTDKTVDWSLHKALLKQAQSQWSDYETVDNYVLQQDYPDALALLNQIPLNYKMSSYEQNEYMGFNNLIQEVIAIFQDGRNYYSLSSDEIDFFTDLANKGVGIAQARACNILTVANNTPFCSPFVPPVDFEDDKKDKSLKNTKVVKQSQNSVNIFPTPANDYFQVVYTLANGSTNNTITVSDLTGQTIYTKNLSTCEGIFTINSSSWNAGIYTCSFTNNKGTVISSDKIVVTH